MTLRSVSLDDKYDLKQGHVLVTGYQALIRACLMQTLSATGVIQAPPKVISEVMSATVATIHDERLSIEVEDDCSMDGTLAGDSFYRAGYISPPLILQGAKPQSSWLGIPVEDGRERPYVPAMHALLQFADDGTVLFVVSAVPEQQTSKRPYCNVRDRP